MVKPINLQVPLSSDDVLALKAGDIVMLNGSIVTARDRIHKYLFEQQPRMEDIPFNLSGIVLYHCGPVMEKIDGGHKVLAAGPTTSIRVEMYESFIIKKYGVRGIMGKGGMGNMTLQTFKEQACVYFHTIGGAAAYLADRITNILDVWKLDEFGPTEAMWHLEIKDFPAIVTMDANGNNIHMDIEKTSYEKFSELIGK
jgi:fumarate hydratase class I